MGARARATTRTLDRVRARASDAFARAAAIARGATTRLDMLRCGGSGARPGGDGWISSGRLDRYARNVDDYMRTKTVRPKAMPRNVATVYPRTPTSMLGTMSDFQRLLEAMAAAVVGMKLKRLFSSVGLNSTDTLSRAHSSLEATVL